MSQYTPFSLWTASLTPLDQHLRIDHDHLGEHVKWLLKRGSRGVVLMGTTGEANSFSASERKEALNAVLCSGVDPDQLMVGTGCCAWTDTLDLTRHALDAGIQNILMLPPFYYKQVSEDGLFAAYDHVMQCLGSRQIQIYLYHFPKMSATPIPASLVRRLIQAYPENVIGFKDSSGDWDSISMMIQSFPNLKVFAGSEQFLLDTRRAEGAGCISATANVSSQFIAHLLSKWETPEADQLQQHVYQIRQAVEQWPMIPALKALMRNLTGHDQWINLRPPLCPLTSEQEAHCARVFHAVCDQNVIESGS